MTPFGLYVHIPFCGSICNYCNFNRGLFDAALKDRYLRALRDEIKYVAAEVNAGRHPVTGQSLSGVRGPGSGVDRLRTPDFGLRTAAGSLAADTIYFGGGTPSLLSSEEIGSIIDTCRLAFAVSPDAEVTLEANPETVRVEGMAAYRAAGVNRVSIGVQSFRDEELRRLGRVHDAARARAALDEVRQAGIDNVSLDLMLWLPQQTIDDCLCSVRTLAALGPSHASLYLLELYPNAPLRDEMARAGWSMAPDEDAADMYLGAIEVLGDAGYEHYEISNFARPGGVPGAPFDAAHGDPSASRRSATAPGCPGMASRHNLKYWTDQEWLAFGCGAHSTMDGVRWKNVSVTDAYVAALERDGVPAVAERRELTDRERFQEAVFMGLRLVKGIDLNAIERRYGVDVWEQYGDRLEPFVDAGLLVHGPASLRLSPRGLLLSNEVMSVFVDGRTRVR